MSDPIASDDGGQDPRAFNWKTGMDMRYPYFTEPDPDLVRIGGWRDPLGLQPVWSYFGRKLVPNLASPVRNINGIKAVLLIHWLAEASPFDKVPQTDVQQFRRFFRLMEGTLEYALWKKDGKPCFGAQSLAQGNSFRIKSNDDRAVANGLHQYYRGTCRRARLLHEDSVANDVSRALKETWSADATKELFGHLQSVLNDPNKWLGPSIVFGQSKELSTAFSGVFDSQELHTILRERLLGDRTQIAFAEKCAQIYVPGKGAGADGLAVGVRKIAAWLDEDGCPAGSLGNALENVQKCEPFLLVLVDCFDYMRASTNAKLKTVVPELKKYQGLIRDRAGRFLALPQVDSSRVKEIRTLAEAAKDDIEQFLRSLLAHHTKCMSNREKDPIIQEENGSLLVHVQAERGRESILDHLDKGIPWSNPYYFDTAGTISKQLFGAGSE